MISYSDVACQTFCVRVDIQLICSYARLILNTFGQLSLLEWSKQMQMTIVYNNDHNYLY